VETAVVSSPETPAPVARSSRDKYGPAGLLASSAARGWSGLSAELRSHDHGMIVWKGAGHDLELCIDMRGNGSVITRRGGGFLDRAVSERGTIWLSPPGLQEESIEISDPVPAVLHVYLGPSEFSPTGLASLRYESAFKDPLVAEIGYALASELENQTSAGKLLAETLALSLTVRLLQSHADPAPAGTSRRSGRTGLDQRRLARVLDYVEAHLEDDLGIDRLAAVACLSRFHFVRAFKAAVGVPPHRYVSDRRLDQAKGLLRGGDRPLVDIAIALNFSCQANFTRAFRLATGQTPGQYRRGSVA
jgi:AraC family transcriptional regulator